MNLNLRRRPEPAVWAVIALAWMIVVGAHWLMPAGAATPVLPRTQATTGIVWNTLVSAWPLWIVMSVAMMAPAAMPAVRHVADNSFGWRRHRAVATFLCFYEVTWAAFGLAALIGMTLWNLRVGPHLSGHNVPLVATLAMAVTWQLTPWKRRQLRGCRKSIPLAPRGWKAFRSCARFGARYGIRCIGSCWAVMLVMVAATAGHLWWTVALTIAILAERSLTFLRQRPQVLALAGLGVAAVLPFTGSTGGAHYGSGWFCTLPAM
jgi:predicted metal-binding membrane protein